MNSSVFAALLACAIAIATAQDTTTGGQEGSMTTDATTPVTTPPITTAPDMAAPNGVDPTAPNGANPAAPAPPSIAVTEAPGQVLAANSSPTTDSDSGSFANAGDIESPVTKKIMDSSGSESSSSVPSETSNALMLASAVGAWTLAGLLGFAAML